MNRESESYFHFDPERPLYKTLSAPLDVQLELTTACDNQCLHCYNFWEKADMPPQRLEELSVRVIIQELVRNGVFYLTITGGEPLLNISPLLTCVEEASKSGIVVSLNTNLRSAGKDLLCQFKDLGLKRILTSLISYDAITHDTISQIPGSYKDTIEGIGNAQEVGLDVVINMVVTRLNLDQVYQTGRFCYKELGISHFCATKASPSLSNFDWISEHGLTSSETRQMLRDLLLLRDEYGIEIDTLEPIPHCFLGDLDHFQPLSKRRCVAALTTCTIGADGSVRPCSHADKSYGNIFQSGLRDPWLRMGEWRTGELLPSPCRECEHLAACGGGCRVAAAYTHKGDFRAEDPFMVDPRAVVPFKIRTSLDEPLPSGFFETKFQLIRKLRFRPESFGGVIDDFRHHPLLVSSDSLELINELKGRMFSLGDLVSEKNFSPEEAGLFFYRLWNEKIIKSVNESYGFH